jgi:hypothetical protein
MANFPSGPDNITEAVLPTTPQAGIHASLHNQLADAVNAIELELLPGGSLSLDGHESAADPHPQYLTQAEADARYQLAGGATAGVDAELRAYIQQIMAVLDPGGPPPP